MADNIPLQPVLLNAGHSVHHADWNWKNVSSPFARLYLVREGSAVINTETAPVPVRPGHLYLIPPFTLHGYCCDDYLESFYFHIYEKPSAKVRVLEEYRMPYEIPATDLDTALVARLLEINPGRELPRYDPSYYDNPASLMSYLRLNDMNSAEVALESTGILNILLSRFLARSVIKDTVTDPRIRAVVAYIKKNIEKGLTVDELAGQCFISPDHFIRLFRKEFSVTPVRYINLRKMEHAQLLLTTTDLPVKNIAYRLSVNNLSYFNRLFKKITGLTPLEYRRQQ